MHKAIRGAAFAATLSTLSGCYFWYPDIPKKRITRVEGESVKMFAAGHEYNARCNAERENCTGYESEKGFTKKDTYATFRAEYNGKTLNQFELRSLVDPEFDKKLASRVTDRKALCNVSLVPSTIAAVSTLALTFIGAFAEELGDNAALYALGAFAGMAGGAALSYPLGGFACMKAGREMKALFGGEGPDKGEFVFDEKDNGAYVAEMVELSRAFNAKFGKKEEATPAEEAEAGDQAPAE